MTTTKTVPANIDRKYWYGLPATERDAFLRIQQDIPKVDTVTLLTAPGDTENAAEYMVKTKDDLYCKRFVAVFQP